MRVCVCACVRVRGGYGGQGGDVCACACRCRCTCAVGTLERGDVRALVPCMNVRLLVYETEMQTCAFKLLAYFHDLHSVNNGAMKNWAN